MFLFFPIFAMSSSNNTNKRFVPIKLEEAALDLLNHLVKVKEKSRTSFLVSLFLIAWVIHRWLFSFSNWLPLALAIWACTQYGYYQRKLLEEDLNKKWRRILLNNSPVTPLEQCEWLNLLLTEIWSNYFNPKLSRRLSSIVEKRLKLRKPRFIERVEVQEFSLGSRPPSLGLQGIQWSTSGDQRVLKMGFDWDTSEMSILMVAKLAVGTARIIINNLHIKGDLVLTPILDGKALLYSFLSPPEVRIVVAFGSGGSQSSTELPGVSPWLDKLFTDTLGKTMVEPRRRCFTLPAVDLRKNAVGGIIYVSVISAHKLSRSYFKGSPSWSQQNSTINGCLEDNLDDKDLQTLVEVEVEELTRRTGVSHGSTPRWDATFNMVLHDNSGILRFNLYECPPDCVKYDYLASCEIKMRHVEDDSTIMWAIGPDSGVIAKHSKFCGDEVELIVPFEGANSAELKVRIVVKEWQFSDGSYSLNNLSSSSQLSLGGSSNLLSKTGRKLKITVVEAKDLPAKKIDPYVKLQYGKVVKRTKIAPPPTAPNPVWNHSFEFDENIGGEYLNVKCFNEETFGDENIGSAHVNLEGLVDGSIMDVWIPLEGVSSGELRLKIEVVRVEDQEGSKGSASGSSNGWIELVLIEARDLIAADLRGTSDPYVRVSYGNIKKRTKVVQKTLNPRWNQTLEFLDVGSPLILHVKDHNALLPTSIIGECVVDYQMLPPNQMFDKWIPLQGVKSGEIHIQITRKLPDTQKKQIPDSEPSLSKLHQIPSQMKEMMKKIRSLIEDGNLEGLPTTLSELESLEDTQEGYIAQLETEQILLLSKINELGKEIINSSPCLTSSISRSGN